MQALGDVIFTPIKRSHPATAALTTRSADKDVGSTL
jgi:hypothetical protein